MKSNQQSGLADNRILTLKEVASYLKVSESTVYRLVSCGKLPGRKVGGAWRFSRNVVDTWFEDRNVVKAEITPIKHKSDSTDKLL